jgi:DNA-binding NarL/FixJ family response regulator
MDLRLLIIADDLLARAGLVALLANQPDCTVVGQVASEVDLLAKLDIYQPDILLWDLGWNPTLVLEQLANLPEIEVPAVVLVPELIYATAAWATGVQGLLPRNIDAEKLVAALQAANQGLITLDPELARLLLPNIQTNLAPVAETLTPRELEVLHHLAQGLPNKTIAHQLDISEHTVKFHVNAIMGKLGAQSRTEAVVRATQLGLILL